ncbi:MAG TPA: response regulator [Planctomycetaceae bacterium]|nr:response regulator [Planctomycetaceae bacterium]
MSFPIRETVLIVEDDPGVAELQRRRLKRAGYEVVLAASADEALNAAAADNVQLAVLDYRLPGQTTGLDLHRWFQSAGYDLPVILVTGFSDEATAIAALRAGVRDFVTKSPAYLDYLPEAVERVLKQVRTEASLEALRQQLVQSQKLEAVGRLAGGVAHDFNNMLTVILGYSEAILDQLDADHPLRADVEEIQQAATRSAGLTRQLLAFSRQQVSHPEVADLNTIVSNLQKMLQRLIGADVELVTRLEPQPAEVLVDIGQIEQVLMNLAVNARDAMPDGGRLVIETANLSVGAGGAFPARHAELPRGSYVALTVTDTGCGMDPQTQARIFEPFFTTKPVGQGTGLGLATVYGIVLQSGGMIFVDTEPGQGSTFSIYLPAAWTEQHQDEMTASCQTTGAHERCRRVSSPTSTSTCASSTGSAPRDTMRARNNRRLTGEWIDAHPPS